MSGSRLAIDWAGVGWVEVRILGVGGKYLEAGKRKRTPKGWGVLLARRTGAHPWGSGRFRSARAGPRRPSEFSQARAAGGALSAPTYSGTELHNRKPARVCFVLFFAAFARSLARSRTGAEG